jgi:hypothetical protein
MDYGLLNAIGITVMCVFGLWAFYVAGSKFGKTGRKGRKKDNRRGKPPDAPRDGQGTA